MIDATTGDFGFKPCKKLPVIVHAAQMSEPFKVTTLEGVHEGAAGDYLMVGIKGERYPCKKEIFEETYAWAMPIEGKKMRTNPKPGPGYSP